MERTVPLVSEKAVKSGSKRVVKSRKGRSALKHHAELKSRKFSAISLKHLAANLSDSRELSKKQAEAMLGDLVNLVTKHLKKGDRIRIGGLGVLVVRKRGRGLSRKMLPQPAQVIPLDPRGRLSRKPLLVAAEAAPNVLVEKMAESAYAPSPRALALLRGKEISEKDLKESGGSFTLEHVETLLGITRQAIDKKVQDDALLTIPGPHGRRRYPVVQFTDDGTVPPGLKDVLKSLPSTNGWFRLNFLVTPDAHLHGRRPVDVLKEGNIELVVMAAKGVGVQGA